MSRHQTCQLCCMFSSPAVHWPPEVISFSPASKRISLPSSVQRWRSVLPGVISGLTIILNWRNLMIFLHLYKLTSDHRKSSCRLGVDSCPCGHNRYFSSCLWFACWRPNVTFESGECVWQTLASRIRFRIDSNNTCRAHFAVPRLSVWTAWYDLWHAVGHRCCSCLVSGLVVLCTKKVRLCIVIC